MYIINQARGIQIACKIGYEIIISNATSISWRSYTVPLRELQNQCSQNTKCDNKVSFHKSCHIIMIYANIVAYTVVELSLI